MNDIPSGMSCVFGVIFGPLVGVLVGIGYEWLAVTIGPRDGGWALLGFYEGHQNWLLSWSLAGLLLGPPLFTYAPRASSALWAWLVARLR